MATESDSSTTNPNSTQTSIVTQSVNLPENGTIPITGHKLTGHNFNQWSHSVMIFVCGKGKEDYLTGTAVQPEENSPGYRLWKVENNMVMSWLLNSMTNETEENFMYYKTAKEIWDAARETYSNKDNTSAVFEIKGILHDLKQGDLPVTDHFNTLVRYWQQLDVLEDVTWSCSNDGKQYKQIQEKERVYKFLLGLNRDLDEVRGRILSIKPLPNVREVFSEVRREETRRKVMLGSVNNQPSTEGSALVVKGFPSSATRTTQQNNYNNQRRNNRPWCDHCKKPGHTKESCWKLHGKPADWKPSTWGSQGNIATTEAQITTEAETGPFNREQIETLHKMLQTTIQTALNPGGTSTATMAQQGNLYTALSAQKQDTAPWIVDSGASDHMIGDITTFDEYRPISRENLVKIADGTYSNVAGIGSVVISEEIKLYYVLFVPNLSYNLLSISKLTRDLNCITKFSSKSCEFQALNSGRTIGSAEMSLGLYLLRVEVPGRQTQRISCAVSSQNKDSAIMLWHYRLGHPNFLYFKKLFPSLINKNSNQLQCEVCQLSKHVRSSYSVQPYKSSHPFYLIYSDVWGPSKIKNISGSK